MGWITEEMLEEMPIDNWEDINYYLHGHCDEWVVSHFQKGDNAVAWVELTENEDTGEMATTNLIHCYLERDGMYLDARGETENWDDVEDGFEYWGDETDEMTFDDIEAFKAYIEELCGFDASHWDIVEKSGWEEER